MCSLWTHESPFRQVRKEIWQAKVGAKKENCHCTCTSSLDFRTSQVQISQAEYDRLMKFQAGQMSTPSDPEWAQRKKTATTPAPALQTFKFPTVQISQAEYDRLMKFQVGQMSTPSDPHAITSGTGALLASSRHSWVLNLGASSHITGDKNLFSSFSDNSSIASVSITDGSQCPVKGKERKIFTCTSKMAYTDMGL
ncbi:hypothetical protein BUALT_Bualt05G0000300 [Buddleja alternifolia]|uniref:Retrovirus-related Pol polyprotein from transposon TNT 1-94-like beta-barrel domain-containing protein n=1 Tax=Buddleja alternifolia TaxID=168488 RepID=A0AAV6XH46_9LAMI|nr:hypothetical protein BUALT_Bualt05G0000300 [Buddleja alternifolia]